MDKIYSIVKLSFYGLFLYFFTVSCNTNTTAIYFNYLKGDTNENHS